MNIPRPTLKCVRRLGYGFKYSNFQMAGGIP
jgi:hypothetical protein